MTGVVEIACPECGAIEAVRKVAVGRYRCSECGDEFSAQRVLSEARDGWRLPHVEN